jgi:hypothetical protein
MDAREAWIEAFKVALPAHGLERAISFANQVTDAFEKRFGGATQVNVHIDGKKVADAVVPPPLTTPKSA